MVSFCGYFPSEKPKYSCLVCIVKKGTPASGGGQCGPVFREISQYLMTKDKYYDARSIGKDNESNSPSVLHGHRDKAQQVLTCSTAMSRCLPALTLWRPSPVLCPI